MGEKSNLSNTSVCVVIPMYRDSLNSLERISMNQIYEKLSDYSIKIVHPESLNLSFLLSDYPKLGFVSFENHYFDGIKGYNSLMLSSDFYNQFTDYTYILIAQLDTYIFHNTLLDFCKDGYDYIGAPWLKKRIYRNPLFSFFLDRKKKKYNKQGINCKQDLYDKIGNGGLSLRKVDSHLAALEKYESERNHYLSNTGNPLYNEDVFWALEVPQFKYPSVETALQFSFDKYPKFCYQLMGNQLPFGCHGWYKWKWKGFWKNHIEFPAE